MGTHTKYSASSAHRWINCPASMAYSTVGDTSGEAAERGTVQHYVAEQLLRNPELNIDSFRGKRFAINEGEIYPHSGNDVLVLLDGTELNSYKIGYDEIYNIQCYIDYVRAIPGNLSVEVSGHVPNSFKFDIGGTADAVIIDYDKKTLHVIDFKTGRGEVSAVDNEQLLIYALIATQDGDSSDWVILLHIVQPPLDNYSVWETDLKKLKKFEYKCIMAAVNTKLLPDETKPGKKQCKYCPGATSCQGLIKHIGKLVDKYNELSIESLVNAYDNIDVLKNQVKRVESAMFRALESGEPVPGYKLVIGRQGNREWMPDVDNKLIELLGHEIFETVLMSPTQASKEFKGCDFTDFTTRKTGKATIAKSDDARAALVTGLDLFDTL